MNSNHNTYKKPFLQDTESNFLENGGIYRVTTWDSMNRETLDLGIARITVRPHNPNRKRAPGYRYLFNWILKTKYSPKDIVITAPQDFVLEKLEKEMLPVYLSSMQPTKLLEKLFGWNS